MQKMNSLRIAAQVTRAESLHFHVLITSSRTNFMALSFFSLVLRGEGEGEGPGGRTTLLVGVERGRELDPGTKEEAHSM